MTGAAAVLCFCLGRAAGAQVVQLNTPNEQYGQGWMFLDTDGHCKVVTPAHVVTAADGSMYDSVTIRDARPQSLTLSAGRPVILSPAPTETVFGLDVALLPLRGADDPETCGPGRISREGIAAEVRQMHGATLEMLFQGHTSHPRVTLHNLRAYRPQEPKSPLNEEGTTFTMEVALDRVGAGWSGSAVVNSEGLFLGMVTHLDEADHRLPSAVSAFALRYLIDRERTRPVRAADSAGKAPASIAVVRGQTPAVTAGQDCVWNAADAPWMVRPQGGRIVFELILPAPVSVSGLTLHFGGAANEIEGMEVATSDTPTGGDWLPLGYERASSNAVAWRGAGGQMRYVRVTLKAGNDETVALWGLTLAR